MSDLTVSELALLTLNCLSVQFSLNDYCKAATVIRSVATAQQDAQSLNGFKVLSRSGSQISALRVEAS
jgi:hypothetical protein